MLYISGARLVADEQVRFAIVNLYLETRRINKLLDKWVEAIPLKKAMSLVVAKFIK